MGENQSLPTAKLMGNITNTVEQPVQDEAARKLTVTAIRMTAIRRLKPWPTLALGTAL